MLPIHRFSNRARIQMVGDNLFGAVFNLIKKIMLEADPFKQTAINKLKESLHVTACQPQVSHMSHRLLNIRTIMNFM